MEFYFVLFLKSVFFAILSGGNLVENKNGNIGFRPPSVSVRQDIERDRKEKEKSLD